MILDILFKRKQPFPFLRLPCELRLIIYELLPENIERKLPLQAYGHPHGYITLYDMVCETAILRTCKIIYKEAHPVIVSSLHIPKDRPVYHYLYESHTRMPLFSTSPAFSECKMFNWNRLGRYVQRTRIRAERRIYPVQLDFLHNPDPFYNTWYDVLAFTQALSLLLCCEEQENTVNIIYQGRAIKLNQFLEEYIGEPYSSAQMRTGAELDSDNEESFMYEDVDPGSVGIEKVRDTRKRFLVSCMNSVKNSNSWDSPYFWHPAEYLEKRRRLRKEERETLNLGSGLLYYYKAIIFSIFIFIFISYLVSINQMPRRNAALQYIICRGRNQSLNHSQSLCAVD